MTIATASADSPIGTLVVAVGERGLRRIALPGEDLSVALAGVLQVDAPKRTDRVRRQLDEYFAGRRQAFELALDLSTATGFRLAVLERMAELPYGATVTYTQLATRAGRASAARAAGHACATNPIPIVVPCHRVVRRDGGLGGYASGLDHKRYLLRLEGAL